MAIHSDDPDPERLPKDEGIIEQLLRNRGFTLTRNMVGATFKPAILRDGTTGVGATWREAYREWYVDQASKTP